MKGRYLGSRMASELRPVTGFHREYMEVSHQWSFPSTAFESHLGAYLSEHIPNHI